MYACSSVDLRKKTRRCLNLIKDFVQGPPRPIEGFTNILQGLMMIRFVWLPSVLALTMDMDLPGDDDDWVMVKKQRVTIWIPPLPISEPWSIPSTAAGQLIYDLPSEDVNSTLDRPPTKMATPTCRKFSLIKVDRSKSAMSTTKDVPSSRNATSMRKPEQKKPKSMSNNADQVATVDPTLQVRQRQSVVRCRKLFSAQHYLGLGGIKPPRLMPGLTYSSDGSTLLNKTIRTSNLEKKLIRAGGLSRWLESLGLGQFVRIFQGRNVGRFQLASMSMKKLKDMGAHAVGPRRKLMHALDCLCEPPCFQAL